MTMVHASVSPDGLLVLPPEFRLALRVENGGQVVLQLEGGKVAVLGRESRLRELQHKLREFVPEGVLLSDELIADRRREAARG